METDTALAVESPPLAHTVLEQRAWGRVAVFGPLIDKSQAVRRIDRAGHGRRPDGVPLSFIA